jgi:Recombination endonuclease VII/NUMOD3 motif
MDIAEATKASWQDPVIRQRRIDAIKAAWTPEKRAEQSKACTGVERKVRVYSAEDLATRAARMAGTNNPYFGKKHTDEIRAKMQRPKGVIRQGLTPSEYKAKLDAGLRWCVDCNDFLAGDQFNKRGYRRGLERKSSICKKCVRRRWLMKAYGVTPEWYEETLAAQGGHCLFCPITEAQENRPLAVDHDHKTGKPRGIACTRCNSALERLEIPGWAELAIAYLEAHATAA